MSDNVIWHIDFKGLAESRLPPEEVGSVVAWPIVPVVDTAPSEITVLLDGSSAWLVSGSHREFLHSYTVSEEPFIAPDGDSA